VVNGQDEGGQGDGDEETAGHGPDQTPISQGAEQDQGDAAEQAEQGEQQGGGGIGFHGL